MQKTWYPRKAANNKELRDWPFGSAGLTSIDSYYWESSNFYIPTTSLCPETSRKSKKNAGFPWILFFFFRQLSKHPAHRYSRMRKFEGIFVGNSCTTADTLALELESRNWQRCPRTCVRIHRDTLYELKFRCNCVSAWVCVCVYFICCCMRQRGPAVRFVQIRSRFQGREWRGNSISRSL